MTQGLEGSIQEKSSEERREVLQRLLEEVFLPQRRLLLEYRSSTWQSALVEDGPFSEMIASIVTGVPGWGRRGIEGPGRDGDLSDGTEVKRAYRIDPNIDFIVQARVKTQGRSRALSLDDPPIELLKSEIQTQVNANASSVQVLGERDGELFPDPERIYRTKSKDSLRLEEGGVSVALGRGQGQGLVDGRKYWFALRQERQHINFGKKTRAQLRSIIERRPVLVFFNYDQLGRMQVSVIRCELDEGDRERYLDRVFKDHPADHKAQAQPYLFADNQRDSLVRDGTHSVIGIGGRLLAVASEDASGIDVSYWDPDGSCTVDELESTLVEEHRTAEPLPIRAATESVDLGTEESRRAAATRFFREGLHEWTEGLRPYCELTYTTRNIGLANRAQHLVSAITGLRGTRSAARGADLVESDGSVSDVKLSTGQPGDGFSTVGNPPLTLGENPAKLLAWRRLFAVRLVEDKLDGRLRVLVHAPSRDTMQRFREHVEDWFEGRDPNGGGGLQYSPGMPFPQDYYGQDKRLDFIRVADFQGAEEPSFPSSVPEW